MPRCPTCHRRVTGRCPDDGAEGFDSTAVDGPPAPPFIGDLEVGAFLGAGGFASVYRAVGDELAIKIAHDALPSTLARFEREAQGLLTIGAPAVPELVEHGVLDDGRPYLVMELVAGETLASYLASGPSPLPLRDSCAIALRILDALSALRTHELAHRDLKPENIILATDGTARLVDFGLVRDCNASRGWELLTRAGMIVGTPEYMAPEQFRSEPIALAADVYAFGVVIFELLTGRPPFVGDRAAVEHGHLHMRPPCPSLFRPISEPLETLVLACLAKEPERRPTNLALLRSELEQEMTRSERASSPSLARPVLKMDSARPVVLVHVADVPPDGLADLVEARRARIARQRADEMLLVFLGTEHERPLEAALALATEATARWACSSVVHVGRALVRHTAGRISLFGRDVERRESWLPSEPWRGALLTARAAEAFGLRSEGPFIAAPQIAPRDAVESLVGRDAELEVVRRARCAVVVGEDGVGKTALVQTLKSDRDTLMISCASADADHSLRQLIRFALDIDTDVEVADESVRAALGLQVDVELAAGVYRNGVRRVVVTGLQRRAAEHPVRVILDDAHFADELTLEILDRACELESRLSVVMTCVPSFPLVERSGREVIELRPLDVTATMRMARQLMPAGTRVSAAVLDRLAQWCGGYPAVLTQLVDVLVREQIIRQHEGTSAWFVAADELDRMPASPAGEWLASRTVDALSPELSDLARICALLGSEVSLDELEAVQRGLETDGYDRPMLDAAAGLSMLVEHGLLVESSSGKFSFRRGAMQEALYALVPEPTRVAVHRLAYLHGLTRADHALLRLAHHGARGGFAADARRYYRQLAARAKSRHAYPEAERMLTAAIDLCTAEDVSELYEQLEERGSVRRLLTHYEGARRDFAQARVLAEQLGDPAKVVAVLVAEAAVCDFTQEWDAQARLMQAAQDHPRDGLPARVEARYANWLGVARARQGFTREAIELLTDARTLGALIGDHETEVGSGLLLGYLLAAEGERDAGFAILQDTITRCERVGDWFHLVIGLNNRIILSKLTDSQGQAEADCQRAIEIAHEHGYHQLEMWGLHNLSIARWWRGNLAGALHAAQLAFALSVERFGTKSSHRERLHYLMHLVAHGRGAEVRALLDGVREQELEVSPIDCANLAAIRLALGGGSERAWRPVIDRTREVGDDCDFIGVLWLRARAELQRGDRIAARKALREAHDHALACGAPIAKVLGTELRALATRSFHEAHEVSAQ